MQIFYSPNSPYARIVRIAAIELALADRIEWTLVQNRSPDSPLLAYSPVCRVPTLVDGDLVLGEARNICDFLGRLAGSDRLVANDTDWQARSLESMTTGFLDGVACWVRELRRKVAGRSEFLLDVEARRTNRCLDFFETQWDGPDRHPEWDFGRMAFACALDLIDLNHLAPDWTASRPELASWIAGCRTRESMQKTKPIMDASHQAPLG